MSLSILAVQTYLASQSGLTTLVPANNIWLDLAGDGSTLPYITLTQVSQVPTFLVAGKRISLLRLQVSIYAQTLASVDAITTALQAALPINAGVTGNTWGCLLASGPNPMADPGTAYRTITEYRIWEDLTN